MAVRRLYDAVRPYVCRRRHRAVWLGASLGALAGCLLLAAALLMGWFLSVSGAAIGAGLWALAVLAGAWTALRQAPTLEALLTRLDADLALKARVRTAWQFERQGEGRALTDAQLRDALAHLAPHTPREWTPHVLPRLAWVGLAATTLACTPLLLPDRADQRPPLTQLEQRAIDTAGDILEDSAAVEGLSEPLRRLRASDTVEEALAALADAESRLAGQTSRSAEAAGDLAKLADDVHANGPELPEELAEQLQELRERLTGRTDAAGLVSALEGIETRTVSAETLARIVAEMRNLSAAESNLLAALEQVRAQKKAIAAAALESARTGRLARLDGTPGRESDDSVALGARLTDTVGAVRERGILTLDAIASELGGEHRVYSRDPSSPGSSSGSLMPFEQVVLGAREAAAQAVNNESLPVAYRDRIRRYFERLPSSTREGTE